MYRGDFSLLGICQRQVEWGMKFAGQSKFECLTILGDVNQERVDTVLGTVAH